MDKKFNFVSFKDEDGEKVIMYYKQLEIFKQT